VLSAQPSSAPESAGPCARRPLSAACCLPRRAARGRQAAEARTTNAMENVKELPHKAYSLVFCRKIEGGAKQILLGMKKRGFGEGKLTGYGGKKELGESMKECGARELQEECGLVATDLEHCASLEFKMPALLMLVEVFQCWHFEGTVIETEEMKPQWTLESELPAIFRAMQTWADDELWLPQVLAGARLCGRFEYASDNETVVSYSLFPIDSLK